MERAQGFVQQGDQNVITAGLDSANVVQASYPGATVTVYLSGTTTLATIFSDNQATPTPMGNPFTANAYGYWFFYAANGRYDVMFSGGLLPAPWTEADILLDDPGPEQPPPPPPSTCPPPYVDPCPFNFCQSPGGTLNPGLNTITLAPVPQGVNNNDPQHWLRISGGVGNPEVVQIQGGTAVAGSPTGTVIVNCGVAHSGAWTICSATSGIQEAVFSTRPLPPPPSVAEPGVTVLLAPVNYVVYAPVYVPLNCVVLGMNAFGSVITVDPSFPLTMQGVFIFESFAGQAARIESMLIQFTQPDSTNIANFTHWPPAVYAVNASRFEVIDVVIQLAWHGIVMTGNSGGALIQNTQICAFGIGISIDGAEDTVYINNVRFYPLGTTNNQRTPFYFNNIYSLQSGRADDMHIVELFTIQQQGIHFFTGADGNVTNCKAVNVSLDTYARMVVDAGNIQFTSFTCSQSNMTAPTIVHNGGELHIVNGDFTGLGTATAGSYWIYQTGISTQWPCILWLDTCNFNMYTFDVTTVESITGTLFIANSYFQRNPNLSYNAFTINMGTTFPTIIGNRAQDLNAGQTGVFINAPAPPVRTPNIANNVGAGWLIIT